ncbi:MAG: hypothetical protein ACKN9V_07795, partial [Pseudomonadota bacterium]
LMISFILFSLVQFLLATTPLDFSNYRPGTNHRPLFEAIVRDLIAEFEHPVATAYRKNMEATVDRIVIDEALMDMYLMETADPKEREAIARFVLAHEYFHVALKHPHTRDSVRTPREIEIRGAFADARKQMETQVDHLAAKYLYKLKLPTEPIQRMFTSHPEFHGGEYYPTAAERAETVLKARTPGIEQSHFDNQVIKCIFLLSRLAQKLP